MNRAQCACFEDAVGIGNTASLFSVNVQCAGFVDAARIGRKAGLIECGSSFSERSLKKVRTTLILKNAQSRCGRLERFQNRGA